MYDQPPPSWNVSEGMRLLACGEFSRAVELLRSEPEGSPFWILAQGNLAQAYLALGHYSHADMANQRALEGICKAPLVCPPPSRVQFLRNRGEILIQQHRRATAYSAFEEALSYCNDVLGDPEVADHLRVDVERQKAHLDNSFGAAYLHAGEFGRAMHRFRLALGIYKGLSDSLEGYAECLTNLAHAYHGLGNQISAELALQEAKSIAAQSGNLDQLHRVELAMLKNSSDLESVDHILNVAKSSAADALKEHRHEAAYLRLAIGAQLLSKHTTGKARDAAWGLIESARTLEDKLSSTSAVAARMSFTEATLARDRGDDDRALRVLERGAVRWTRHFLGAPSLGDLRELSRDVGDHFRVLSRVLLDQGRNERALFFLEFGRAVCHCIEVDARYLRSVLETACPPSVDENFETASLGRACQSIPEGTVALVIVPLPPELVCYVADAQQQVRVVRKLLPEDVVDKQNLVKDTLAIPYRLPDSATPLGKIPPCLTSFASMIADEVGGREVAAIMPHAFLHAAPWRALLNNAGLPWRRMPCAIEFNLLLRALDEGTLGSEEVPTSCRALGHGGAEGGGDRIDFADETRAFAESYPGVAQHYDSCRSGDVRHALSTDSLVLLSCHGKAVHTSGEVRLALELEDGRKSDLEVFPAVVRSPVVVLSACESGVYLTDQGDYPVGGGPTLLQRGARFCIGARHRVGAQFAFAFCQQLSEALGKYPDMRTSYASVLDAMAEEGWDPWKDVPCLELLGGP